jgi:chromosome segregation ATPase
VSVGAVRRVEALQDARRRDSEAKRAHVRTTIENMLSAGDAISFASVARRARVSSWLVYSAGMRELVQAAISRQAEQSTAHRNDKSPNEASVRSDLAHAREEIKRLRAERDKLRRNAQRLLGRQLDQSNVGDLVERVDGLVEENRRLAAALQHATGECSALRSRVVELEEDVAAARTALRRMIREQTMDIGAENP